MTAYARLTAALVDRYRVGSAGSGPAVGNEIP
jgi:hypothetical protein